MLQEEGLGVDRHHKSILVGVLWQCWTRRHLLCTHNIRCSYCICVDEINVQSRRSEVHEGTHEALSRCFYVVVA
jgi:hypothetical protein